MKKAKLCGYDLNGWRDLAARNWSILPGEGERLGPAQIGQGGLAGAVVRIGEGKPEIWVGGKQADLAPHGLGGGWGEVGAPERKISIRALIEGHAENPSALSSAIVGLASGARFSVMSIDDAPSTTEAMQERMLAAMVTSRLSNPMLVWRSVLAALYYIAEGHARPDTTLGIINHSQDGFSVQRLRILQQDGRNASLLAPERRFAAQQVGSEYGYESLLKTARETVLGGETFNQRTAHRAQANAVARLLLGEEAKPEILRTLNGDWDILEPPSELDFPLGEFEPGDLADLGDCDEILLESLTTGTVRKRVEALVSEAADKEICALPVDAVARGALEAATRISGGDPVYFDFLPNISTIVFSNDGAQNYDLVDGKETLEAGRYFRSKEPARLGIPAGQSSISVYLNKEAEEHPRKVVVDIGAPLPSPSPVSLWVEQKPAAGRARILLEASDLGRQFVVDWEAAEEVPEDWDTIIDSLENVPPTIPARLILSNGMHAWEDGKHGPGLSSLLAMNVDQSIVDWDDLAAKLASRPFKQYCISSDGELPTTVDPSDISRLEKLTKRALEDTIRRTVAVDDRRNNSALKFLTWQFKKCPEKISELLLECVSARSLPLFKHPFVTHPSHLVLVYQGLGRISSDTATEERILRSILETPINTWNWRIEAACLALLLSRSETAPLLLTQEQVQLIAKRILFEFKDNLNSDYTKFFYAPFLLAGLLRFRLCDPQALVEGRDEMGSRLASAVQRTLGDFNRRKSQSPRFKKAVTRYQPILLDLAKELQGQGTNPDLLLDIYNTTD
ncbi:hypothetical protein DL239_15375 [Sedimentitalea sp. CY04]|uniref:Uncharacterized protein n=1 Tax=Parasedimentitalea denitrificans TaxID=2211118 RepID=A0ABX0WBW6_9RHOB|nr:hypothetical protein [Sedimentitalea sp. CY04]NIZ62353.1 hypothetical protein [Sedimentitalea sp. CY04]